jgi:hypothetical protein
LAIQVALSKKLQEQQKIDRMDAGGGTGLCFRHRRIDCPPWPSECEVDDDEPGESNGGSSGTNSEEEEEEDRAHSAVPLADEDDADPEVALTLPSPLIALEAAVAFAHVL